MDEITLDVDGLADEELVVLEWRVTQLQRLGLSRRIAREVADFVDWHDVADLVERGCAPELALEIVR